MHEPERRTQIRLEIVALSDARPTATPIPVPLHEPAFRGPSDVDYVCGGCGALICEGVRAGAFTAVAFHCSACNGLNQVPVEG